LIFLDKFWKYPQILRFTKIFPVVAAISMRTHRQTERQIDRQTDRPAGKQVDRQAWRSW